MRILAGTSGYSYPAWRGRFYPQSLPASRMLAAYAARLPTVEINATFYRMPQAETLARWASEVPPGFVFALKAPSRVTHAARLAGVEEDVARFLRAAAELGGALGPVLWQLPPTLPRDLPLLRDFLALLPRGGQHAVEFRHPSWRAADVLQALSEAGAALCVVDAEDGGPAIFATAAFGYLRLRRAEYEPATLARWLDAMRAQSWREAYVFFKHEARGPEYALRLNAAAEAAGVSPHPGP